MKSQGLPLSTIVILVIVIVVLVAVILFFFTSFGEGGDSLSEHQKISACQTKCARAKLIARGVSGTLYGDVNCNIVCGGTRGISFCIHDSNTDNDVGDFDCNEYIGSCQVTNADGDKYDISCSGSRCTCQASTT